MTDKTAVCVDCGQTDLREHMIKSPRGFIHTFTRRCQNTWQSQVEAADSARDAAIARAEAAERRVQELEAQLAAQAWRPVTEPPEKNETITLLRQYTPQHGYEYQLAIWESVKENLWKGTTESDPGGYWFTADNEGDEIYIDDWQEWQLLMRFPPPTGGNSIEFWVDDNDEWHVESPANAG